MWGFSFVSLFNFGKGFKREYLHSLAVCYWRSTYRHEVLSIYRTLQREVKQHARHGGFRVTFVPSKLVDGRSRFHAYRFFTRKHPDFAISWGVWLYSDFGVKTIMSHCPYLSFIEKAQLVLKW